MMKLHFKKILLIISGSLLVFSLVAPGLIYAKLGNNGNNNVAGNKNFCTQISNWSAKALQAIVDREAKVAERQLERQQKMAEKWAERDAKLAENRAKWAENRERQFEKLEERATTTAQKEAVANFKATVESAVFTRQTAIDSAKQTFRQGLEQLISDRKSSINTARNTFRNSVQASIQKAQADCNATSSNAVQIRLTFKAELKAAKDKLKSDLEGIDKIGPQVKTLTDARRQAFETAFNNFKAAMEQARIALKAAFNQ